MKDENKDNLEKLAEDFLIGKGINPEHTIEKIKLLKKFNPHEAVKILNFFASKETDCKVLLFIVQMLGRYRHESSTPLLIDFLTDYKRSKESEFYLKIRCAAASILGEIRDESAIVPLMYIMNDKNEYYQIRLSAAEALGKIGSDFAVSPLIKIVTDEEEKSLYLRESAVKALGMIGDERAIEPLISIIETKKGIIDKFTFLKERIIEALGKMGLNSDRKLHALKTALLDESPHIRIRTIEALGESEDESILEIIEPMVYDRDSDVAKSAIQAIYSIKGREHITEMLETCQLPLCCIQEIHSILEEEDYCKEEDVYE